MSRLLLQIYHLMKEAPRSPSILFDLEIICSDGTFLWNQFLMAAFSKTLGDVMKNQDDLFSIIVPDLSIASVKSILHKSLYPNHEDPSVLSDEDRMTFKLLTPQQYDSVDLSEQLELQGESNSVQEKNIFKCDFENCTAKFVRRLHLERHQSIHVRNSSFEKLCDLCGKVFYHEDYLKLHLRSLKNLEIIYFNFSYMYRKMWCGCIHMYVQSLLFHGYYIHSKMILPITLETRIIVEME